MADEYRFYQLAAEVLEAGDTSARFYQVAASTLHSDQHDLLGARLYQLGVSVLHSDQHELLHSHLYLFAVEVLRGLPQLTTPEFVDDGGQVFAPSAADSIQPTFVDDGGQVFAPQIHLTLFGLGPPMIPYEWNPYRPDIPHEIQNRDPAMYDYMREQAEILREQHDLSQAGGSTFPWQLALQTSAVPQFQLGALSRFHHQDYGVILARYVRFSPRWNGTLNAPVGRDLKYSEWVVTDQLTHSHWTQAVGISLAPETDNADRYGWVLVQGRGLCALRLGGALPSLFAPLTWVEDGYVGLGAGKILCYMIDLDSVIEFDPTDRATPAGTWYCDVGGVTDEYIEQLSAAQFESIDNRLDALEAIEIPDYTVQFTTINGQLSTLTAGLENESRIRSQTDRSFQQRIRALEDAGSSGGSGDLTALDNRVTILEETLVPRVTALETAMGSVNSTVSAHSTEIAGLTTSTAGLLSSVNAIIASFATIDIFGDVDTSTTPPTDRQLLGWINADSMWKPVTLSSTDISDFAEAVDDRVATLLVAGTDIALNYDDGAGTLEIEYTGTGGGGSFEGVLVNRTASLTAQNFTTLTAIPFNQEIYDYGGWHDNSTNPSRLTVPSGVTKIQLAANVRSENKTAGDWIQIVITKNGTNVVGLPAVFVENAAGTTLLNVISGIVEVTSGDYFECRIQVESDTSSDVGAGQTWFAAHKIE